MTRPRPPIAETGFNSITRRSALRAGLGGAVAASGALLSGCASARSKAPATSPYPGGRFVTVDGLRIHGVVLGEARHPTDPTLVMIHGAAGNHRDWTYQLTDRLAPHARIIALDRPGFGLSDRPDQDAASPIRQANLLWRAAVAMGMKRAIVVGHSFGGAVAMAWALEHPKTTAGLIILAGATMPWPLDENFEYLGSGINTAVRMLFSDKSASQVALEQIFAPQKPSKAYVRHVGLQKDVPLWETVADLRALNSELDEMAERYGALTLPVTL
ncbi:MAG: alpha/beta fold hydrolase, partial [Pseudomonadota bacterium]